MLSNFELDCIIVALFLAAVFNRGITNFFERLKKKWQEEDYEWQRYFKDAEKQK